jgi:hypothetical protein
MTYTRMQVPIANVVIASSGLCAVVLCTALAIPAAAAPVFSNAVALADQDDAEAALIQVQAQLEKPHINIGKVVLVEPASETPLPIQVGPIDAIPRNSFVRIRGVPSSASLSEGHSIAPGSWAIPLSVLPNLRISIPVGVSGKSDITIALVQIDGTVLAESRAALVVAAAELIAPSQPTAPRERSVASVGNPPAPLDASPPPASRPPVPAASLPPVREPPPAALTEDQKRALTFVVRGRAQAQQGNIAAARLFYQRAAEANLAEGALALAGTYDPAELAAMGVAGVLPDIALARRWYEKARDLGAREAEERLRRLSSR